VNATFFCFSTATFSQRKITSRSNGFVIKCVHSETERYKIIGFKKIRHETPSSHRARRHRLRITSRYDILTTFLKNRKNGHRLSVNLARAKSLMRDVLRRCRRPYSKCTSLSSGQRTYCYFDYFFCGHLSTVLRRFDCSNVNNRVYYIKRNKFVVNFTGSVITYDDCRSFAVISKLYFSNILIFLYCSSNRLRVRWTLNNGDTPERNTVVRIRLCQARTRPKSTN